LFILPNFILLGIADVRSPSKQADLKSKDKKKDDDENKKSKSAKRRSFGINLPSFGSKPSVDGQVDVKEIDPDVEEEVVHVELSHDVELEPPVLDYEFKGEDIICFRFY